MGDLGFSGLKSIGRDFLEASVALVWPHPPPALFVPEPPTSDDDVMEPLRRRTP